MVVSESVLELNRDTSSTTATLQDFQINRNCSKRGTQEGLVHFFARLIFIQLDLWYLVMVAGQIIAKNFKMLIDLVICPMISFQRQKSMEAIMATKFRLGHLRKKRSKKLGELEQSKMLYQTKWQQTDDLAIQTSLLDSLASRWHTCLFYLRSKSELLWTYWIVTLSITSFNRTFGCPIICIDTYSQCYFRHWHLQQCLIQSSSLVSRDTIFGDKSW